MNQPTDSSTSSPVNRPFRRTETLPGWFAPLFFLFLASLFLWRSTFAGEVFLPANLLGHVAPWSSVIKIETLPPWNPLRWDGIAQFYPWRHFAHDTIRAGTLPLWNPYQFCGTPFVANSQSAVFYPGNILFYILPTDRAFGASALLHLTLCGWFTYLLLRRLGCHELSALFGGIVYTFSAWQINWLQLPTFLATSCWFPLLLDQIYSIGAVRKKQSTNNETGGNETGNKNDILRLFLIAGSVGMLLLAGHLQIAFYGLLTGTLWAICLLIARTQRVGIAHGLRFLAICMAGLCLGAMLALPQVLPALELSKLSHRQSKPSQAGYKLYVEYSLPAANLVTLTIPEFLGTDSDPGNPYYGFYVKQLPGNQAVAIRHNAAETAVYVGLVPLLLASLAITLQFTRHKEKSTVSLIDISRGSSASSLRILFFSGLALMALLLALGTPLNTLFYFLIPGFEQSGSPARCLVLWALAIAALSAFGLDALTRQPPTRREASIVLGSLLFVFVIGLSLASQALRADTIFSPFLKIPVLGEVLGRIGSGWLRALVILTGGAFLLFAPRRSKPKESSIGRAKEATLEVPLQASLSSVNPFPLIPLAALGLVIIDLFLTSINVSQTVPASSVYPLTSGIRYLQEHSGHDRVVPINKFWSLTSAPPAVFPPNAATVYGLRDAQGYDSLLTGQYKRFADTLARQPSPNSDGSLNAAPAEVGNMIFIQNPLSLHISQLGAAFALTLSPSTPNFARNSVAIPQNSVYNASNEMAIYPLSSSQPRAHMQSADGSALSTPVIYQQDDPTRVILTVNAPTAASLILADQFYPGWYAQLDGKVIPIEPSGKTSSNRGVFRAVSVPAGPHTVIFYYAPSSFRIGLYLACFSSGVLACLLTLMFNNKHHQREHFI